MGATFRIVTLNVEWVPPFALWHFSAPAGERAEGQASFSGRPGFGLGMDEVLSDEPAMFHGWLPYTAAGRMVEQQEGLRVRRHQAQHLLHFARRRRRMRTSPGLGPGSWRADVDGIVWTRRCITRITTSTRAMCAQLEEV